MSHRTKALLMIGMLVLAVFFLMRRGSKQDFKSTVDLKRPNTTSTETIPDFRSDSNPSKPNPESHKGSSIKSKNIAPNEADAGLIKLRYMKTESGQKFIRVKIEKYSVCHPGDFEAMTKAVGKNGEMLISLEPLGGKGSQIQKVVKMQDIERGVTFDLQADPVQSAVYGIFLCADSSQTNSCLGKRAANFNTIIGNPNAEIEGKNAVYYFQTTFLQPDNHLLYTGNATGIGSVRDYIQANGGTTASDAYLLKAKRLISGVNSLPAKITINDKGILITLPIAANLPYLCANPSP